MIKRIKKNLQSQLLQQQKCFVKLQFNRIWRVALIKQLQILDYYKAIHCYVAHHFLPAALWLYLKQITEMLATAT